MQRVHIQIVLPAHDISESKNLSKVIFPLKHKAAYPLQACSRALDQTLYRVVTIKIAGQAGHPDTACYHEYCSAGQQFFLGEAV